MDAAKDIVRKEGAGHPSDMAADMRFRVLLGEEAWARLPEQVRARFSKRLNAGDVALYRGRVNETTMSRLGRLLSFVMRIVGSPLPTMNGATGPAVVIVTEEPSLGGQRWLRIYERPGQKPQMVQSIKRFRGATGLEEYVGAGITMQLALTEEDGALVFRSGRYLVRLGDIALTLPRWLAPGRMTIVHRQQSDGSFAFTLTLQHAVFGRLLYQAVDFRDVPHGQG